MSNILDFTGERIKGLAVFCIHLLIRKGKVIALCVCGGGEGRQFFIFFLSNFSRLISFSLKELY